ncbi:hypothetical protein [Lysinibacillus xylanilyticus]|uniref:hypothetical protein n=1 Tax=Lysinibacillus xylanilyticus TaxID=582475 RepID=UPI003D002D3C
MKLWLKGNLISISTLFLTLVTILIMINANNIMKNTNKIMERQIEVDKADKIPIINFEASYREDQNGFAKGEIIAIYNEGGIMTDFNSEGITYIEIEVLDFSRENEKINIKIPIRDYYGVKFATGALQKKIITYDNLSDEYGNNRRQFNVINEFIKKGEQYSEQKSNETGKIFEIGIPEFKTYFNVTYKDIYNQKQDDYYEVGHSGAKIINNTTGEKLFSSEGKQFQLADINENMLLEIIKKRLED